MGMGKGTGGGSLVPGLLPSLPDPSTVTGPQPGLSISCTWRTPLNEIPVGVGPVIQQVTCFAWEMKDGEAELPGQRRSP